MKSVLLIQASEFIRDGTHGSPVRTDTGIPVLSAMNVREGILNYETDRYTSNQEYAAFAKRLPITSGDVLLTIVGTIGRSAVVNEALPLVLQRSVAVIRPKVGVLDSRYLFHVTKTTQFQGQLVRAANKSSQAGVYLGKLGEVSIPLPPLPEQRRIAAILDQADGLLAKRRQALEELDQLTQSIFIDMFGDPVTNPKGWPRKPIQAVCSNPDDIKCGPFGTQLSKDEVAEEGVPLWGIKNVNAAFSLPAFEFLHSKTAIRLKAYDLRAGDIVMTRKGTIGNCAVYPNSFPDGIMHSDLLRIRTDPKLCLPGFLSYQLHHSKDIERQIALISGGAVMPGINVTKLKNIEAHIPPMELQTEFVERSSAVDGIRKKEREALDALNGLFSSLQHRAFRGEL